MLSLITQEGGYEVEDLATKTALVTPYIRYEDALAIERGVSEAWNYYDAQVYYRMNAALYGRSQGCKGGQKDSLLSIWDGKSNAPKTIPDEVKQEDYCDGSIPENPVPWFPLVCPNFYLDWAELARRYAQVMSHAQQVYHPKYLDRIGDLLRKRAPNGISWSSYRTPIGAFFTPVRNDSSPKWEELVQKAKSVLGSKGAIYAEQAKPGQSPSERTRELGMKLNPSGSFDPPGVSQVERLKPTVVTRKGVHDQPLYWAGQSGGPVPTGEAFAGPPDEYEIYGMGSALFVYARPVTETSPRTPTYWVGCFMGVVYVPIPLPVPIFHATLRVNTAWHGLVEGYAIPLVSGVPTKGVR